MKYLLLALVLALGGVACSKHEVYDRNLVYMTEPLFVAEKSRVSELLALRQQELSQAEASGDPERVKAAKAAFLDAQGQYKGVEWEARRRQHHW